MHLHSRPAAAGSRPIVSCSSAAQRIQQLSAAIGQEIGEARHAELTGSTSSHEIEVADALTAATAAVEEEAARVVSQPRSDEGDAELQVLTTLELGIGRDLELLGLGDSPTSARADALIHQTVKYRLKNLQRSCNGGGQQPAAVLLAHAMQAFAAVRQLEMLGAGDLSAQALALRAACLRRVRIRLDVTDTSKVDDGQFDVKAGVTADDIEIAGRDDSTVFGGVALHAPDVNLSYGSSSVTVDPPYSTYEEAKITETSGLIHVNNVGYSATTASAVTRTGSSSSAMTSGSGCHPKTSGRTSRRSRSRFRGRSSGPTRARWRGARGPKTSRRSGCRTRSTSGSTVRTRPC